MAIIKKIHNEYLLNANNLKNYLKKIHIYSDEQKYFEKEQEEKMRQMKILKEKERMKKISPNYNQVILKIILIQILTKITIKKIELLMIFLVVQIMKIIIIILILKIIKKIKI